MKFDEQVLEKSSNIIKSYTSLSINIHDKNYDYNIMVPPSGPLIKCNMSFTNISHDYIIKALKENVNFVIIALDNTECIDKTPIILGLNEFKVGIEFMNFSAACSSHNILLSEKRNFLSFFLFQ